MLNESAHAMYTVTLRGMKVECETVEQVVEVVQALAPLQGGDREVAVPTHTETPSPISMLDVGHASPVTTAVYALFRENPRWRRPIEIVKALRKQRVPGAKYTTVYAALRYGDFVKRDGEWNLKSTP